ncbi:hypothetical protein [Lysinibacillus piscis]|uniref:Uncharacterized protein n=1 Tax=Lysinibacillus piscis TaxID=2518931 RepID=A0ABQ5NPD7_9BACI|nr:hypothetical protein [Lysinibacillus sp. KH24]GLC90241.1 hypothetical protein LYSBPC_33680 [Lysinibacillus sp. KH24]
MCTNNVQAEELKDIPSKQELIGLGVNPSKVGLLQEKLMNGEQLEADIYLEKHEDEMFSSSENPHFRKDFSNGSFIETMIEDITEEDLNIITPYSGDIEQIGGL